ncbi:probable E3 ubiquitin-protein ligase DTX2 isoform X2 [Trichomycterus rosablanca]|uniref:probable E3 ubiquitin-protein ligase DTX2 isoform X2 n=1 Tax=Trichomycterus rosablanca TaxID=2290929 RepID=UPI002F351095
MATAPGFSSGVNGSRSGPSVSASSSGSASQAQPMVMVWEWQDYSGLWRPYSSQVSCFIEQCLQQQQRPGCPAISSISLGQSDPSLSAYIIDIPNLKQFRQDSGKMRSVRRSLYPQSSALSSGVLWEWANDEGGWTAYEMHTSLLLEHSYQTRQASVDLAPQGHNYVIELLTLEQINKKSGYRRRVRRQSGVGYPSASGSNAGSASGSVIHSGAACMCHQCLNHGPMPGRSRNSFSGGAGPSYSPYPRRPLSVGHMALGGPWSPAASSMGQPPGPSHSFSTNANGLSVTAIPLQLNGSSSVSAALAAGQKPEEVIKRYMEEVSTIPDEDCMICMERLSCLSGYDNPEDGGRSLKPNMVGKFTKCGHTLHMLCMLAMYNNGNKDGSLQCPSCKTIYGEKTGTQPKGKMEIYCVPLSLPGHSDCGTIQIIYNVPPGIQGPEHPKPGQAYTSRGFPRLCFLPDNEKGRKVLELLKVAWTRRLIFTVGTSSTTGEPDTVVWNEIHHKTEMMSNVSGHGYPDPNYLDNVLAELAAQGVTEDCLKRGVPKQREPK